MKGLFFFFFFSIAAAAITLQQFNHTLHELWGAAMAGDATKYHSLLASNVVVVTNGEEDDAPWQQESFIKGLFAKVRYRDMKLTTPVGVEATTGTFFCHFQWSITMLATGQDIEMGGWSTRVNFDSAGKISRITNIGLTEPLSVLATALSSKKDLKETVQNFVSAMNAGNAPTVSQLLSRDFVYASNGEDIDDWAQSLPSMFEKARWNIKILDYAAAGPGEALVNVEATVQAGGNSVTSLQGWHVIFNTTAPETISSLVAIQDSLSAYETKLLLNSKKA
jgi:hypothetical protein